MMIINLHVDASVASPLQVDSNLRDLILQTGNFKKTSFRDWPYNWPEVSFHKIIIVTHPRASRLYLGAKVNIFFEMTKYFAKKR